MKQLVYEKTGMPVTIGDIVTIGDKEYGVEHYRVENIIKPLHEGSTGRVEVQNLNYSDSGTELYYPSVIGAKWEKNVPYYVVKVQSNTNFDAAPYGIEFYNEGKLVYVFWTPNVSKRDEAYRIMQADPSQVEKVFEFLKAIMEGKQ